MSNSNLQLSVAVNKFGSDLQIKRFNENLLDDDIILRLIHDDIFSDVDCLHCDESFLDSEYDEIVIDKVDKLSEAQFSNFKRLTKSLNDHSFTFHKEDYIDSDGSLTVFFVRASIVLGEFSFSGLIRL